MKIFRKIIIGAFIFTIFVGIVGIFSDNALAIGSGDLPGSECGPVYDDEGNLIDEIPCFSAPEGDIPEEFNPDLTFREVVIKIINYFLTFTGLVATAALIYSGVLWVTSGGNEEQFGKGKKGVMYALLGIILILLSYTVVNWVIGAGDGANESEPLPVIEGDSPEQDPLDPMDQAPDPTASNIGVNPLPLDDMYTARLPKGGDIADLNPDPLGVMPTYVWQGLTGLADMDVAPLPSEWVWGITLAELLAMPEGTVPAEWEWTLTAETLENMPAGTEPSEWVWGITLAELLAMPEGTVPAEWEWVLTPATLEAMENGTMPAGITTGITVNPLDPMATYRAPVVVTYDDDGNIVVGNPNDDTPVVSVPTSNGTISITNPAGSTSTTNIPDGNGSITIYNPDGSNPSATITDTNGSTYISDGSGVRTPDGTVVVNDDGTITVTLADGTTIRTNSDGTSTTTSADGQTTTNPAGSAITLPNGTTYTSHSDGSVDFVTTAGDKITAYPNGKMVTTKANGTVITRYSDGTLTVEQADGTITTTKPDGTIIVKKPNGTITTTYPDGTVVIKKADGTIIRTDADGTVTTTDPDGNETVEEPEDYDDDTNQFGGLVTDIQSYTGDNIVVYTQESVDNLLSRLNTLYRNMDADDERTIARFKTKLDQLYSIIPHTNEMIESYGYLVEALGNWASDPNETNANDLRVYYQDFFSLVKDFPRMNPKINAKPVSGKTPLYVFLDGSASSDPNNITIPDANYHWTYIDNSGQTVDLGSGPTKEILFENPGSYVVNLIVETLDIENGAKTAMDELAYKTIRVLPASTNVQFNINGEDPGNIYQITRQEATEGLSLDPSLSEPAEGRQITDYFWEFGNGSVDERSSSEIVNYSYGDLGQYQLTLTTTDNLGEQDEKSVYVYVKNNVADIDINPTKGTIDSEFKFDASNSKASEGSIKSYLWEIKGPESFESSDKTFTYKFSKVGDYEAKLTVTDIKGESVFSSEKFKVYSQEPYAVFNYSILKDSDPATVRFDASRSSDPDGDRLTYSWDFDNDGIFDIVDTNEMVIFYTFPEAKTYKVRLQIEDPFGQKAAAMSTIKIDSTFKVDFTASTLISYVGEEVIFNAISKDAIGFKWDFDDGITEINTNASQTHVFNQEGKYRVRLTVTSNLDEENSVEKWVHVGRRDSPTAVYDIKKDSVYLMPTDGICYGEPGFEITRSDILTLSAKKSVNVDGERTNLLTNWDFHDGTFLSDSIIKKRFNEITDEDSCIPVTLTVTDNKSKKSDSEVLYFKIKNALPSFDRFEINVPDRRKETPINIPLLAVGAHDPDGHIVQYTWWAERELDPGEKMDLHTTSINSSSITILPRGQANQVNRWNFFVEIKDDNGGVITNEELFGPSQFVDIKNNENLAPVVDFRVDRTSIKMGETITFTGEASDPQGEEIPDSAFTWDFDGDNIFDDTSSGPNVVRRFDIPGEYKVRMKVVHRGLASSKTRTIFVERTSKLPLAAFTYQITGRKVLFNGSNSKLDTSVPDNDLELFWDFDTNTDTDGDGVANNDADSTELDPEYIYPNEGFYQVRLVVKDKTKGEDFVERTLSIQKSGQVVQAESVVSNQAEKSLQIDSINPITTLFLVAPNKTFQTTETMDLLVFVKNADGSPYSGKVDFRVLEGSANIIPDNTRAMNGEAASTIHPLGAGNLLVEVTANNTVSGDLSETILLIVE